MQADNYVTSKQPVCWVDNGVISYDQDAFGMLDAEGQALVRQYGNEMLEQWQEAQAAQQFAAAVAEPVTIPPTPSEELVASIGEVTAALLAVLPPLNRLADALGVYKPEPPVNAALFAATLEAELRAANASARSTIDTTEEDEDEPQH